MRFVFRSIYHTLVALTGPFGGIKPRRMYDLLARHAFDHPEFQPFTNRWGDRLRLSHFYHIDRNILNFGTYDPDLHQAFERLIKPGMIVFDVGANLGEMSLHMARLVGAGGQVWAFEPVHSVYQRLSQHVQLNHVEAIVHCMEMALSDRTGQTTIAAPDESADNQGLGSITNLTAKAGPVRSTIATITLDDFVAQNDIQRIDLMKIDIQGAEPKLLAGGIETLKRLGPDLLMEFSPDDLRQAGLTSQDLARRLSELGYEIHPLNQAGFAAPLRTAAIASDFAATNVLCRQRARQ